MTVKNQINVLRCHVQVMKWPLKEGTIYPSETILRTGVPSFRPLQQHVNHLIFAEKFDTKPQAQYPNVIFENFMKVPITLPLYLRIY